jgi:multiple sugar transport system permease protein
MAESVARRSGLTGLQKEALTGYLFISPWVLGFLFFMGGPIIFSLALSFAEWNGIGGLDSVRWVGLDNFRQMTVDHRFYTAVWNTFYFTSVSVPVGMVAGVLVALLMNQKFKSIAIFRTIFYLPSVMAGVASSILFYFIFHPSNGLLNFAINGFSHLLTSIFPALPSFQGPEWLGNPAWAKPAYIIMSLWGVGSGMIIYLAGLQGIPEQLYEAAEIDGANKFQQFLNVTLPMLSPVIFFNLILSVIGSFQVFTQAFILSGGNGAPADAALFYVLYVYQVAFQFHQFGYGSAMAWMLFIIIMVATLVQFKFSGWVYYEGELKK